MKKITQTTIVEQVADLVQETNYNLPEDVKSALIEAEAEEKTEVGRKILQQILKNADIAAAEHVPLCQDTGITVVFARVGQDLFIEGNLEEAINQGVRKGYQEGFLRKSVVDDPFSRKNTEDNTPAIIHYIPVEGDKLRLDIATKGGGSENMSKINMLKPTASKREIVDYIVQVVTEAGANACPPLIIGVGIGGNFEKAALLAKESLFTDLREINPDPELAELEDEILARINRTGIGPQGLGGRTTALAVNIKTFPCHIASMPVAVNLNCHSARHISTVIEGVEADETA
ncbi:MAG: fumarate hydratase [Bacillota bacterium]